MTDFDIDRVRACYPALAEGFVHLDGAGGTQVAGPVADAVAATMRAAVSNRSDTYEPGRRSTAIVAEARAAVADLLGGVAEGVVFGPGATDLTYLVARTLARSLRPGDEVVVTRLDHDANVRPWVQAAETAGATVRWADFDPSTGALPAERLADLINARTRVVALTAASNATGAIPPVREIADLAHARGALVYVDGVHATAHLPVDVRALGADFYVTSAYKWSGPHLAAVIADPSVWQPLRPAKLLPSADTVPDRFELSTRNFELLAGVTAAVDHFASLSAVPGSRRARVLDFMTSAAAYEQRLLHHLLRGLSEIPEISVCPAPDQRCPTVSFRLRDQKPSDTARRLGDLGLCVPAGDFYAYEYFTATGLRDTGGAVRASLYHYNTTAEIDRLLAALRP